MSKLRVEQGISWAAEKIPEHFCAHSSGKRVKPEIRGLHRKSL